MTALSIQPTYPIFTDIDGQPLEDGYVWIGVANLAPIVNPITVYWDAALTIPAAQPIRTRGGYPINSGTPVRLYVNSDYSIQVQNRNGSVVYSAPTATERYSDVVVSGVNAEDVIYDPPFTNAVATNVEAKLAQTVSIQDFGAVGDGVTDDTAEIQAAIDAVSAAGGGTVLVPTGTFMVNMLTLGIFLKDNVQVVGTGTGSVLKGIPIAGTSNFVYVVSIATCSNAGISNCLIDASRPPGEFDERQWHGIRLEGDTSNILIENNVIKECKGDGMWIVLNPGFSVPPTKALIRGNRISNVNRQDIALVQGTDITLTDNFGTGNLDIESDLSNYINTGHIVSNNQFNQILISPLSGETGVRNNIVVSGNKCNAMYLWGVNFVQVTGNVVNGLITVAQSGDVAIVGNFCQGVSQLVANGTFIQRLIVRDNTIISSTETKGIWLKDVVNAEISDNLIRMTAVNAVGVYQANNNVPAAGEVRIYNNKIDTTDDCIQIVSAALTNTTHSVFGNYLKSSSGESISKDGASQTGKLTVTDNDIYSAVSVGTTTSVAFHKNRYYSVAYLKVNFNAAATSIVLDGERFYGSLPTLEISGNAVTGSVIVRDFAGEDITIGASAINFFNTTATDVLFDNVVSSSATPYTALTATVRTGSLIRITGSATRYGVWYNGTSWIDLA